MAIDPQILALIGQLTNSKGDFNKTDYNRIFDPMVGVLSNTYTQPNQPQPNEEDLVYQYMPTYNSIKNSGYYDENSLEQSIISSVENGIPLSKIKQMILDNLDKEGNTNQSTSTELLQMATTIDNEFHAYNVAKSQLSNKAPQKTIYEEAGLPNPTDQYNVDGMLQKGYENIAKAAQPYKVNTKDTDRNRYYFNLQELQKTRQRKSVDAMQQAANDLQMKSTEPYAYGGSPGVTDFFTQGAQDTTKMFQSKNPINWIDALVGGGYAIGAGKASGRFIDRLALDIFRPYEGAKREQAYVDKIGQEVIDGPNMDPRERNQVSQLQRNVMGSAPKNYVPIRTELVNKQRADRAMGDIKGMRELVASRLASTGNSPFNDELLRRALYIKSAGK